MSKKNKLTSSLGRSLIKDRFGGPNVKKFVGDKSMLHTTEIQDGYNWGRLNLQSVTEESSFQEFLSTAELAGTEFQAEKLNIYFINPRANVGLLSAEELSNAKDAHEKYKDLITIPRRPPWSVEMTLDEFQQNEKEHFLTWRRKLAQLQEKHDILLTPFEKNLEFWRQLWRVVERCDVIVQIVDARNPLLFRCEDLEKYVKEVSKDKLNLILINKADFLNEMQRQLWVDYFTTIGVHIVFFSALAKDNEVHPTSRESKDINSNCSGSEDSDSNLNEIKVGIENLESAVENSAHQLNKLTNKIERLLNTEDGKINNSCEILSRDDLIDFLQLFHKGKRFTPNYVSIGLVGYPNVGKSSTINALLSAKKVPVSATPGKTKHFQTLLLNNDIMLCDCPGLVMPSFVYTKAEMVINGILPIDQIRDHVPPINLIASLIPRHVLEDKYGFMLPLPLEGEDPNRHPLAEELLNAYGYNRGFMTANGQPDNPRAARYILKDFVNGSLLYAHAPPNVEQNQYHTWPERRKVIKSNRTIPPREKRAVRLIRTTTDDIDKTFFQNQCQGVHTKGKDNMIHLISQERNQLLPTDKPWKKINKHENKKKREKLRRVYAHLDQH